MQLTLFGLDEIDGPGRLFPRPSADTENETEAPAVHPDQLTFEEEERP